MNDQLMLGILLIIVGVAMGLIAAALVLNRRERRASDDDREVEEVDELDDGADLEGDDESEGDDEQPEAVEETGQPEPEVQEEEEVPAPIVSTEAEDIRQGQPRDRQLVARVYREDVTGKLIVLSGDSEYSSASQITDDTERRKLAYAATDFASWFDGEIEPRAASAPSSTSNDQGSSDVMLEEINRILQRSIPPDRGVRLFPSLDGGVKVLIGVKSYEIEEVPDEEIKELIRQAVAEWEAGR